jgi:hypothetical protein
VTDNPSYTCYTLFDIPDKGNRSQVRNWNTIVQIISLRTQPFIIKFPDFVIDDLSKYNFGEHYKGEAKIWTFEFEFEHPHLFEFNDDPIAHLKSDTDFVPLVDYNNFIHTPKCLLTSSNYCNIYYVFNK